MKWMKRLDTVFMVIMAFAIAYLVEGHVWSKLAVCAWVGWMMGSRNINREDWYD